MRSASQVVSRRSRGVGMWGRARAALLGTRCGARALPPGAPAALLRIRTGVFPHSLVCGAPAWLPPPPQLSVLPLQRAPAVHSSRLGVGVGNSWSAPGKRGLGWKGTQLGGLRGDQLPELLLV